MMFLRAIRDGILGFLFLLTMVFAVLVLDAFLNGAEAQTELKPQTVDQLPEPIVINPPREPDWNLIYYLELQQQRNERNFYYVPRSEQKPNVMDDFQKASEQFRNICPECRGEKK